MTVFMLVLYISSYMHGEGKIRPGSEGTASDSLSSSLNSKLYFTSYKDKEYEIYWSENKNGIHQVPESLALEINHLTGILYPYIAPDESYRKQPSDKYLRQDHVYHQEWGHILGKY